MSNQQAKQDDSQFAALLGHSDLSGTAETRRVIVDNVSNGLVTVDFEHKKLHAGESFFARYSVSLNAGGTANILVTTPNSTKYTHMLPIISVGAEATVTMFEAGSATGGTAISSYNRNRNSSGTATTVFAHTPTITSDGTQIIYTVVGAGNKSAGEARGEYEIILRANTKYIFRTVSAANTNLVNFLFDFYEHVNGA